MFFSSVLEIFKAWLTAKMIFVIFQYKYLNFLKSGEIK